VGEAAPVNNEAEPNDGGSRWSRRHQGGNDADDANEIWALIPSPFYEPADENDHQNQNGHADQQANNSHRTVLLMTILAPPLPVG
jgi:hypothetical protein